jgi:hypothetical protein
MLSDGGKYQMVSTPEHRKSIRFEHKSTVMLSEEHSEYFSYAQMFNFSGGGLYLKSDVAYKPGTKIQIQFDNQPFRSGPKTLSSVVRWCRELTDYDSAYTFGVGVKFN